MTSRLPCCGQPFVAYNQLLERSRREGWDRDGLVNIVPEFRHYLKQKRYKRNTANGYCNYAGLLLRKAKQLGWVPSNPEIPREWEPIMSAVSKLKGARGIINFGIA